MNNRRDLRDASAQVTDFSLRSDAPVRTPRTFCDVDDWLEQYDRVARFTRWSDDQKLNNVYFSLDGTPMTWYENREASLTSWNEFRRKVCQSFTHELRVEREEQLLQSRVQLANESVTSFVEDVLRLFRRADPHATEEKKVQRLMRRVREDIFVAHSRNPPALTDEFLNVAARIERSTLSRSTEDQRRRGLVGHLAPAALGMTSLRELIREIVREEVCAKHCVGETLIPPPSIADMVKEEVQQVLR